MVITRRKLLTALAPLAVSSYAPDARAATPLAVIVGLSTPIEGLTRAELKRLFLAETNNISGVVLVPFNMAASIPERTIFLRQVLAMSPDQESKYWIDRRIRGQSGGPKTAPNSEALLKVAAKFPKAITYVPAAACKPDVKVLRVDGKLPSDAGYALIG